MDTPRPCAYPGLDDMDRAKVFAAVGSALQLAAANSHGLRLHSCTLEAADWDCALILQQLPVNTLTSLNLQLELAGTCGEEECVQRLAGVRAALPQLQQLRKLSLTVDCFRYRGSIDNHLKYVDPLLKQADMQPLLGLTNLISLKLNSLWSVG